MGGQVACYLFSLWPALFRKPRGQGGGCPGRRRYPRRLQRRWSMAGCPRAGPRQMRARAWPASFIAGWVHGGASHSGGGEIGLAHYLSVSIGFDMSLSVSIGLGWCRPVSIGPSRPRWVSVGPDRSRSASIGCGSSGACPRPIGIDRRRSRPTETGRYRQNRSRLISTAETDQDRSRPIETDRGFFFCTRCSGRSGPQRAHAFDLGSGTGGVWHRLPPRDGGVYLGPRGPWFVSMFAVSF